MSATADQVQARAHDGATRLVLVAVGAWDRRAVAAIQFAAASPSDRLSAVHVAADDAVALELGCVWMAGPGGDPPLEVLDDDGGVAATLAAATGGLPPGPALELRPCPGS